MKIYNIYLTTPRLFAKVLPSSKIIKSFCGIIAFERSDQKAIRAESANAVTNVFKKKLKSM